MPTQTNNFPHLEKHKNYPSMSVEVIEFCKHFDFEKLYNQTSDKLIDWYIDRTDKHIHLVQKYCNRAADLDNYFKTFLLERAEIHDGSKYTNPEFLPYVWVNLKYRCKSDEEFQSYEPPEDFETLSHYATYLHVVTNSHHPEYHSDNKNISDILNRTERDKPPKSIVDARTMPLLDVAEMVCDWMAVSEERGSSAKDWADKNIDIRWRFSHTQKTLIYGLIDKLSD